DVGMAGPAPAAELGLAPRGIRAAGLPQTEVDDVAPALPAVSDTHLCRPRGHVERHHDVRTLERVGEAALDGLRRHDRIAGARREARRPERDLDRFRVGYGARPADKCRERPDGPDGGFR